MSSRSYLSIGDVLTLLRQEFPDVTISKIRFLESQGLVNPERTPSGYRKFYEHDVERLRWVLRQQREHFLPLKVIKDRLEDDTGGSEPAVAPPVGAATGAAGAGLAGAAGSSGSEAEAAEEEPVLVGQRVAAGSLADGERPVTSVGGPTLPGIESPAGAPPSAPAPGAGPSTTSASRIPAGAAVPAGPGTPSAPGYPAAPAGRSVPAPGVSPLSTPAEASASPRAHGPESSEPSGSPGAPEPSGPPGEEPAGRSSARSAPRPAAGTSARQRRRSTAPGTEPAAALSGGGAPSGAPVEAGGNMSVEELSALSGLDPAMLLELQGYGLLTPTVLAGLEYFDEDGLTVATAAARFAQFGVEPRHLRLYKNAAVREAGFIEQIVLPMLRQRNPEARARARETVEEISALGLQLRSALLRMALRGMLGD